MSRISHENLFFEVDSRLLLQLGEKLVTNISIALAELVKNSYDADATKTTIVMEDIEKPGGFISIEDNGIGMTVTSFKNSWMRIATNFKVLNPYTKVFNRRKSGEKGIGRFACRRLSDRLIIETIGEPENGKQYSIKADFNWKHFKEGSDVNKIPVKVEIKELEKIVSTFTKLSLIDTRDVWDKSSLLKLKRELYDLFTPSLFRSQFKILSSEKREDPGFQMKFVINGEVEEEEKISREFFSNAWGKVKGFVDDNGQAEYTVHKLKTSKDIKIKDFKRESKFKSLKNCEFIIYWFKWRSKMFQDSDWKEKEAQNLLREKGGIKLFVDNVRIFSYGSQGDDWLSLDKDKAIAISEDKEVKEFSIADRKSRLYIPPNDSVYGYAIITTKDNPQLEITADREQLISNTAFKELTRFIRIGIDFIAVLYTNELEIENREKLAVKEEKRRKEEQKLRRQREKEENSIKKKTKKAERLFEEALEIEKSAREKRIKIEDERREMENLYRNNKTKTLEDFSIKQSIGMIIKEEKTALRNEQIALDKACEKRKTAYNLSKSIPNTLLESEQILREELMSEQQRIKDKYDHAYRMLFALASVGLSITVFQHEISALLKAGSDVRIAFNNIKDELAKDDREYCDKKILIYFKRLSSIEGYGNFLGVIMGQVKFSEKEKMSIYNLIEDVYAPFDDICKSRSIEFSNKIPKELLSPKFHKAELASIFFNLLSNSFKAVKGMETRKIEILGYEEEASIFIIILDTGKGLEKDKWEIVFEPFISFSDQDDIFGEGTGLGLTLVQDILNGYNGTIKFAEPPEEWNTKIIIEIEKGEDFYD